MPNFFKGFTPWTLNTALSWTHWGALQLQHPAPPPPPTPLALYNIWKLDLCSKTDLSKTAWIMPVLLLVPVFLFIYQLCFQLARNIFHLFLCNFTQICFSFLKKTLWFFLLVFGEDPTHFIPVISEKSKFVN